MCRALVLLDCQSATARCLGVNSDDTMQNSPVYDDIRFEKVVLQILSHSLELHTTENRLDGILFLSGNDLAIKI